MSNDTRIALLENTVTHIGETLARIESRLQTLDTKFDGQFNALDHKIDSKTDMLRKEMHEGFRDLNHRYQDLNSRLWFNFIWTISAFVGMLAIIAKGFHWL